MKSFRLPLWLVSPLLILSGLTSDLGAQLRLEGTWNNDTFGSSGGVIFETRFALDKPTLLYDINGPVFGVGDAPPVNLDGQITSKGVVFSKSNDPFFGKMTITLGFDGTVTMLIENPPASPGIRRETSVGRFANGELNTTFIVEFTAGGTANGRVKATQKSGSLPFVTSVAQVGDGGGITSDAAFTHPSAASGAQTATGAILFANDSGDPLTFSVGGQQKDRIDFTISPLDAFTFITEGIGAVAKAGSAVVVSNQTIGGIVRFNLAGVGIVGVGTSEALSGFITPVRKKGGVRTGLAIRNLSVNTLILRLRLRRGGQELLSKTLTLSPGGHIARFIDEADFFGSAVPENFDGTAIFAIEQGTGQISATALELGSKAGEFTAAPVTPLRTQ